MSPSPRIEFFNVANEFGFVACAEHRYVPLEQAVTLITEDLEAYARTSRAGIEADPPDAVAGNQPPRRIAHALSLLLEGRLSLLTEADFDTLVSYLRARKETLFPGSSGFSAGPQSAPQSASQSASQSALPAVHFPQQQFQPALGAVAHLQQQGSSNYAQQFGSSAFAQTPYVPAAVDSANMFMQGSNGLYAAPNLSSSTRDLIFSYSTHRQRLAPGSPTTSILYVAVLIHLRRVSSC